MSYYLIRAGVGRTALFIGLRIAVEQAHAEKTVDLVSIVNKMRQQRMKMIQTEVLHLVMKVLATLPLTGAVYLLTQCCTGVGVLWKDRYDTNGYDQDH